MAVHTIAGTGKSGKRKLTRNASRLAKAGAKGGIGKTVKKGSKGYTTSHLKKP